MEIIENSRGNTVIYQNPTLRNCWGFISEGNYITDRSLKKGQIFHHFKNAIAIQLELLEYLEKKIPEGQIKIRIDDYEKEPFWATIPVKSFRKKALQEFGQTAIFCYDRMDYSVYGKQIRLPMSSFTRIYDNQTKIKSYHE